MADKHDQDETQRNHDAEWTEGGEEQERDLYGTELERYQVRRMAPALRRNLLALGEHMCQAGALATATDIFHLGLSELGAWIQTACPTAQRPGARRGPGPESLLAPPREASGA